MMTDPIADMLTRIRNAVAARHERVRIPYSRLKREIARILEAEGFVNGFQVVEDFPPQIEIALKYGDHREPAIAGLRRISHPGRRVYRGKDDIPVVLNGMGIAIVSTSRGVLTDRQCREAGVGGEVLCAVW